jgi:8-oxo-dGTP diphosphatase
MPAQRYCYEHPRPAVTVDAVVLALRQGTVHLLLIRRKSEPYAGRLALPGGFLEIAEDAEPAARRELQEETGITTDQPLRPIGFYAAPDRDPRGRTISLAFLTVVRPPAPEPHGGDDADSAAWHDLMQLDPQGLAFDHARIVAEAVAVFPTADRLPLELLPDTFTGDELRAVFGSFGRDARTAASWRQRAMKLGLISPSGTTGQRFRANWGRPTMPARRPPRRARRSGRSRRRGG